MCGDGKEVGRTELKFLFFFQLISAYERQDNQLCITSS